MIVVKAASYIFLSYFLLYCTVISKFINAFYFLGVTYCIYLGRKVCSFVCLVN